MKTSPSIALPKVHPGLHLVAGLGEDEARLGNPVNGEGGASQPRHTSRQAQSGQKSTLLYRHKCAFGLLNLLQQ